MIENPPANAGNAGSISGSGRSPGDGEPIQYSGWQPIPVFLPEKSQGQKRLVWQRVGYDLATKQLFEKLTHSLIQPTSVTKLSLVTEHKDLCLP